MVFWSLIALAVLAAIAGIAAGPLMSRVEQPKYEVINRFGEIELRSYAPVIAAETTVEGERKPAIEAGFRRIAAYIFGANKPRASIAMTAPVLQTKTRKIAMTAPVIQQAKDAQNWTVSFIMPSASTLATLPEPDDARVRLVEHPRRQVLAATFSGLATEASIEARVTALRDHAARWNLTIAAEPELAIYNPPWTLPPLRRNEVLFAVEMK